MENNDDGDDVEYNFDNDDEDLKYNNDNNNYNNYT